MFWTRKVSPYQLQRRELIDRAREWKLPDAKLYGEPGGLGEIFDSQHPIEGLRRQIVEQERWNRDQNLWLVALWSAVASVISALAAWTAILYVKQG